ncbi:MAG TPA: DUF1501 domain-containing protein [Gemmataceae bacterium]|nr:DUF1501 domain-containing protein [Gemmataceae bacterium]
MSSPAAPLSRRAFLVASGLGLAGSATAAPTPTGGKAKSTILFFLCGGASHIDTWDMKPDAPAEYRGPFQAIDTSAPGIRLCEHLPLLAKQAHHLAVVRSVGGTVNTNDHHAGYYYQLTGHVPDVSFRLKGNDRTPYPDDWPFVGCVAGSRRPAHPRLPNVISLPHKPSKLPYTRPGQFAARLGPEFDPLYVQGSLEKPLEFRAPALVLGGDVTASRLTDRDGLRRAIDAARSDAEQQPADPLWERLHGRALTLLSAAGTAEAFDLSREPLRVREKYGPTVNGASLLLARRLVEAGVPFVTVYWMENEKIASKCKSAGGWDTHGNNFNCLKEHLLPEFDRGFAALVSDLSDRGLLDSTLLWVTSEMGRTPKIGDPRSGGAYGNGRDHWTHCMSVLLAGAGVRGGQTYGTSDRRGEYPADRAVTPADVAKTVYHAMGITDLEHRDREGRPYDLMGEGEPLTVF